MGACVPAKTSERKPPLDGWHHLLPSCCLRSARRAELPAVCLAWEPYAGAAGGGWSALFAGECACACGAVRVDSAKCRWQWEHTARRSSRNILRTVRQSALVGSRLLRRHAQTGSCLTCTIRSRICGRFVCPDVMLPSCCGSFPFPYLSSFSGAARLCVA